MRNKNLVAAAIVVVILIVAGVLLAQRKSDNTSSSSTMSTMPAASNNATNKSSSSNQNTVTIKDFAFNPGTITVKAGTKVTWTNEDDATHTVTADTPSADAPASHGISKGSSYSFTFAKAGTYAYHCSMHPYMKATVIVTE